jgi:prepilin-type N-terminal cleavage/methylation domain-containing protein
MTAAEDDLPVDEGFTLVELMVAMGLFLMLMSMVMSVVLSTSRATRDVRQFTNINEQARIATERLTRELRQAKDVRSATLSTTGGDVELTFGVDFNGVNGVETVAADPEVLTYRYDHVHQQLTLTANDESGTAVTRPILSEEVSAFKIELRSSLWQYDANLDGITDWTELDAAPGVGNNNHVLDAPELQKIDLVSVTLSVLEGQHKQTYETQVSLRNMAQS